MLKGKALLRTLGIDYATHDPAAVLKAGTFKIPFDRVYADLSKRMTLE